MQLSFFQTADPIRYSRLIEQTSKTVRAYTDRHGASYESYLGVKKGSKPWQAAFNRVFILKEMIDRSIGGWVCYLDADAWICDMAFDLRNFLSDKTGYAGIFASSGASEAWWDINNGIFLLNLDHPFSSQLVDLWLEQIAYHWPNIEHSPDFPVGGPDDQSMLHDILASHGSADLFYAVSRDLINSQNASFIRQHLRADQRDFEERLSYVHTQVDRVLAESASGEATDRDTLAWNITEGLYLGLLGRHADGETDNGYYRLISQRGPREGIKLSARSIIDSPEFNSLAR